MRCVLRRGGYTFNVRATVSKESKDGDEGDVEEGDFGNRDADE